MLLSLFFQESKKKKLFLNMLRKEKIMILEGCTKKLHLSVIF